MYLEGKEVRHGKGARRWESNEIDSVFGKL